MSLEALGNIGEFIGAIGVVLSLVYLAFQVRDNSRFVRENSEYLRGVTEISSNEFNSSIRAHLFNHPELIDVLLRGHRSEDLDRLEQAQYNAYIASAFEAHFTYYLQHERGLTGEEVWQYWSQYFDQFCTFSGIQRWWKAEKQRFSKDFQMYID